MFNVTTISKLYSSKTAEAALCQPEFNPLLIARCLLSGFTILFDLCLIISVGRKKSILRENIVNIYVLSCLLFSMFYCCVVIFDSFQSMLFSRNEKSNNTYLRNEDFQTIELKFYSFWRALLLTTFLGTTLGVLTLIYGLHISTNFLYLVVNKENVAFPLSESPRREAKKYLKVHCRRDRGRTTAVVVLSWLIPFILAVCVPFGWNCIEYCHCLPGYYGNNLSDCILGDDYNYCSEYWAPMTQSFVVVIFILWFLSSLGMFCLVFKSARQFWKSKLGASLMTLTRNRFPCELSSMHPTVQISVLLSCLTFTFSLPLMILLLLDVTVHFGYDSTGIDAAILITLLYVLLVPILLLKYVASLQKAVKKVFLKWFCLQRITPKQSTRKHSSSSDSDLYDDIPLQSNLLTSGSGTSTPTQTEVSTRSNDRFNQ